MYGLPDANGLGNDKKPVFGYFILLLGKIEEGFGF
jgi:hypothetical protein